MSIIYKYDNVCYNEDSDSCLILNKNKDAILKLVNDYNDTINSFVSYIGNYERGGGGRFEDNTMNNFINYQLGYNFYDVLNQKIRNTITTGLRRNFILNPENGIYELERKNKMPNNPLIKTKYSLIKSNFFGTGNLSVSILLEFSFLKNINNEVHIINSITKIYPLTIGNSIDYFNFFMKTGSLNSILKRKFDSILEFVFYKEALIGCWVQLHIIKKKISGTFACTIDAYISKQLPINQNDLEKLRMKGKIDGKDIIKKRWVKQNIDDWKNTFEENNKKGNPDFGIIEMEKIDFELSNFVTTSSFSLGFLFEVYYSKLCLAFIGNVYPTDDHYNNIMVKYTNKIRKYRIKRRDTYYNFYINNNYIIKYIDMERYEKVINRNIYTNVLSDGDRFYSNSIQYLTSSKFSNIIEGEISKIMLSELKYNWNYSVDKFCEFMHRILPNEYIDDDLYINNPNVDEFYLDLDVETPDIFLNPIDQPQLQTNKLIQPYKLIKQGQFGGKRKIFTLKSH